MKKALSFSSADDVRRFVCLLEGGAVTLAGDRKLHATDRWWWRWIGVVLQRARLWRTGLGCWRATGKVTKAVEVYEYQRRMARACRVNSPKPGIRARLSCAIAPILPRWLRLRARYLVGRKLADNGHFLAGSEFVAKKGEEMRDWPEELILAELAALSRAENAALTTGSMSRLRNIFGYRFHLGWLGVQWRKMRPWPWRWFTPRREH
jgi:hypothetical protein